MSILLDMAGKPKKKLGKKERERCKAAANHLADPKDHTAVDSNDADLLYAGQPAWLGPMVSSLIWTSVGVLAAPIDRAITDKLARVFTKRPQASAQIDAGSSAHELSA